MVNICFLINNAEEAIEKITIIYNKFNILIDDGTGMEIYGHLLNFHLMNNSFEKVEKYARDLLS
ncbi:hypothetical protein [Rickettsiales endosymbiont of Trichoplax sp. H2]|uniref:hypothetical protein n=1 Tax=Rickettsiales endosymbiont of Trichoplax sp. H2 TaxID=2021221 RepID=UPI0012B3D76D|nr:hypothetical protein [Rickettsiales endosymbiont of Trichoplax sp. H2]MSO13960.1 hypothetical protein [Rickettsiales endosymbiont of Trichoplax sp. H2]